MLVHGAVRMKKDAEREIFLANLRSLRLKPAELRELYRRAIYEAVIVLRQAAIETDDLDVVRDALMEYWVREPIASLLEEEARKVTAKTRVPR